MTGASKVFPRPCGDSAFPHAELCPSARESLYGLPSARGVNRDTSNTASGSWKEHRARQRFEVGRDALRGVLCPHIAGTARRHASGHRPSAYATYVSIRPLTL